MGLFDIAANFLTGLLSDTKRKKKQELPGGGDTDVVAEQAIVNPDGASRYSGGNPGGSGGGARIITDPRQAGRYTAQGKDLGYNPLSVTDGSDGFDEKLYSLLMQQRNQPITNEDYYPSINNINKGNVTVGDMSAPVYAGSLGLPPMAAMDKMKTRQYIKSAMDSMMADREESADLGFIPPDVRQAAIMPKLGADFEADSNRLISELQSEFGKDWRKKAPTSRKVWEFTNKWKSKQTALDQGYDKAAAYLKLYDENQKSGNKGYFPEEAVMAAKWLMTGVNEMTQGLPVDANEIAKLSEKLVVLNNYGTWADETLKNKSLMSDIVRSVPEAVEIKVQKDPGGATDLDYTKYRQANGEFPGGYHAFLIEKQIQQISEQTARANVERWSDSNPGAWKQLRNTDSESKESVLNRTVKDFQNALGTQIQNEVFKIAPPRNTNITVNNTSGNKDTRGIYQNTVNAVGDITKYIRDNTGKMPVDKLLSEASKYGDASGSLKPDKDYFGFKLPGTWALANKTTTPERFANYVVPDGNDISIMKPYSAKEALSSSFSGTIPENMAPTSSRIKDVLLVYGVPDANSAGGYKIITKATADKRGLPDSAELLALQQDELIFDMDEYEKLSPIKERMNAQPKKIGDVRVARTAYRIYPATEALMRQYDKEVSDNSKANSPAGQGQPTTTSVNVQGDTNFSEID